MIELDIDEVVPSVNRLMRMHWAQRRKLQKKWHWLIWLEFYRRGAPKVPKGRLAVHITRYSFHVLDDDNLHGAAKVVLDALKTVKILTDDSPAYIALTCDQIRGGARTVIRVSPYNEVIGTTGSPGEPC